MKLLTNLDLSRNEIKNVVIHNLPSHPSEQKEGQVYFNTSQNQHYAYRNGKWTVLGSDSIADIIGLQDALDSKGSIENEHNHKNKTILDGIDEDRVTKWDNSVEDAKDYTDAQILEINGGAPSSSNSLKKISDTLDAHKESIDTLDALAKTKADDKEMKAALDTKANKEDMNRELALKAVKTEVNNALSLKADAEETTNRLAQKADKAETEIALSHKVDNTYLSKNYYTGSITDDKLKNVETNVKTYVDELCETKASVSDVRTLSLTKADDAEIKSILATKANLVEVNNELSAKADAETVNSELEKKALKSVVEQMNVDLSNAINTKMDIHVHPYKSENWYPTWNDVTDKPTIPTKTSQLTNDSNFLTEHQDISGKADKTELHNHSNKSVLDGITSSKVTEWNNKSTFDGNYNSLTNKPTIPTKTSQLTNDSNFLTQHQDISGKADKSEIPTKTSQLTNDSNFLTSVPSEYVTDSELNAKGYLTEHQDISHLASKEEFKSEFNVLEERLDDVDSQLSHIENVANLLIEDYSEYAEGNDYSNVIKHIMDNVVDETKRTVINFKPGKDYIINAKINKRNVTLTGSANIIGKLEVGLDDLNQKDTNNPWYDSMMHCIIDGLSFVPTMYFPHWDRYNEHGIWLFNARSVTIRNCYFANMKYPIYFKRNKGEWIHQHTHRVRILNCTFMCVGYNLYGEEYDIERVPSQYLEYGDIDFQGNFCEETKIANIKMGSMDGFTCFNNTFFLEKAEGNIDLYYTPGVHISNNRIFEPGTHAINIYKTQDFVITGNHIFNSGYRNNESAIRIECGLWFEKDYGVCGVISENIFRKCQGSAIEMVNSIDNYGCTNYIITSNYMHIEASGFTPIKASGYSQGVVISNNISNRRIEVRDARYAIANNNAHTDSPGAYSNDNTWTQWNSKDGESTMNLQHLGANQYLVDTTGNPCILTVAEPTNKERISNYSMLIIKSLYGKTTLKNTSFIQTKTKEDIVLHNADDIAVFMYINNKYVQIF